MIFGRPPNLVLAVAVAIFNTIVLGLAAFVPPITLDVGVVGAVNIMFTAVIALIANTPPTLQTGDKYNVSTASGQPDVTRVVTERGTVVGSVPVRQDDPPE
jgi:hypothetical protein